MLVLDRLTDKVYYFYKRFEVQILLTPKIKWCLDLMINNNHQKVKHKKKRKKKKKN